MVIERITLNISFSVENPIVKVATLVLKVYLKV